MYDWCFVIILLLNIDGTCNVKLCYPVKINFNKVIIITSLFVMCIFQGQVIVTFFFLYI